MPEVYAELDRIQKILESHFKDMQDIEFTVEDNHLYLLQTRTGSAPRCGGPDRGGHGQRRLD